MTGPNCLYPPPMLIPMVSNISIFAKKATISQICRKTPSLLVFVDDSTAAVLAANFKGGSVCACLSLCVFVLYTF